MITRHWFGTLLAVACVTLTLPNQAFASSAMRLSGPMTHSASSGAMTMHWRASASGHCSFTVPAGWGGAGAVCLGRAQCLGGLDESHEHKVTLPAGVVSGIYHVGLSCTVRGTGTVTKTVSVWVGA